LLDEQVGAAVTVGASYWSIAGSELPIDLVADCLELALLELGDADAAPALGGTNERGIHQLQDGTLAKGMRDHLGAPALLTE
jgi:hypothetical protein